MNHEASAGKCREYTVINRDNQWTFKYNTNGSSTKRRLTTGTI
jgi:YD repeat-containing protein